MQLKVFSVIDSEANKLECLSQTGFLHVVFYLRVGQGRSLPQWNYNVNDVDATKSSS